MGTFKRFFYDVLVRLAAWLLQKWFNRHNVLLVLIDLDDTLCDTHAVFDRHIQRVYQILSDALGVPVEGIVSVFQRYNRQAFLRHAVCPEPRWQYVVDSLREELQLSDEIAQTCLKELLAIYQDPPKLLRGSLFLLKVLQRTTVNVGLITHANEVWTYYKLQWLKLGSFFHDIIIVDENGQKDKLAWQSAAQRFGVQPHQVLIFGDNITGDIVASRDAGMRWRVWIDRGVGWTQYREGAVPYGTVTCPAIGWSIPYILWCWP
jgi:FMN phosphatase YigB (HAD superfamily)